MYLPNRTTRPAFSLMEMVIALAIGMLLMAALYSALTLQFQVTKAGRETIEEGALVRAIFTRMQNDIMSQVSPYDPRLAVSLGVTPANLAAVATATTSPATSGVTPSSTVTSGQGSTTNNSSMQNGSTGNSSSSNNSSTMSQVTPVIIYNVGVYGTSTMLQLSNYRVQTAPAGVLTGTIDPNMEIVSDVRRVTYWLMQSGSDTAGLGRREFRQATADDINSDPSQFPDPMKLIIAKEVSNILFEYYDGTQWQQQWTGFDTAADDVTPIGPPVAIRITLTLRRNANRSDPANDQGPTYQHVVALPTANFNNNPAAQVVVPTTQP